MGLYVHDVRWLYQEAAFSRMLGFVDENRRVKARSYRFVKDRALSLGAGLLLNYAYGRLLPTGAWPSDMHFNDYGKPFWAEGGAPGFNLSHAGIYVACAIGSGPVGVDIEEVGEKDENLTRRCFVGTELPQILSEGQVMEEAFCRHWVLKESYVKFLGAGLSLDPLRIEILIDQGIRLRQDGLEQACSLALYEELPGYKLALCRQGGQPEERLEVVTEKDLRAGLA
ncbi:MAG: 4'-phosphopantetheinyl transferase superfamily protein [Clostridiaceae bacterium]|jgi:4'-phosphopantetheinyl transferase|nr:4'-phosphopantetheinyl transferase superfamily protein [Clostridiaceae bacterium]